MTRTRAGLMALAFTGWVGSVHALALGEIDIHSRLNQPLLATIPVSIAKPGELEGATVELASNDEFERAGIERTEFLSSLRFEVKDNAIRVTSKQIAREPFVSFLLDIRWGGGHLLREYTVLLDPPTMTAQQPAPRARTMPAPAPAPAVQAAAPAPATQEPAAAPEPGEPTAASTAEPGAAPAEAPAQPAAAPQAEAPAAAGQEGGTYGPISPKETLWSIAYKLRPDPKLTMDQMQVAIFNLNPQAFDHGRLTGLMKGSILRIPTADDVRAVDPVAAKAQVARARAGGGAAAPAVAQAPAPAEETTPAPAPKAEEAPAPTPPPAETAPPPSVEEKAPAPAAEATPPPAPAAPTPETKAAAKPKPAPAPAAKVESPSFVDDLIARAKSLPQSPLFLPAAAGFVILLGLLIGFRTLRNKYAQWAYERAARREQQQIAPSVAGADMEETAVAPPSSMEQALHEAAAEEPAAPAPMSATQALGTQTLQQTQAMTQALEPPAAQTGGQKVDFDVTGTFANETVQINLDAGDPVSEAEFHRAYGLYDEAALLLKQALQKDPKRTDARVKLAEIYFEASKANEFVEVAKELKGQLPPAEWQKIALLGTQIAPNNEMFAGGTGDVGGTVDLSFDEPAVPSAPAAAPAAAAAPSAAPDAGTLDFKLEDIQLPETPAAPAAPSAPAEGGLEFDLGSLSLDTPSAAAPAAGAAPAAPAAAEEEFKLDLGDFDVGASTPEPAAEAAAAPAAPTTDSGEVLELGGELTVDEPAPGDESSTKLDLARAYIDMGDNDMAKSLLNEVAQQGNDAQKKEAEELLKRVPA